MLGLPNLRHKPQHELLPENTEVEISPSSLRRDLTCRICKNLLKKMMRTKQCLHRFCSDCINTALRSGKKECPTCRKKLVSKRCLLPEPRFDLLISQIWPQEKVTPIFKRRMSSRLVQRRECSSNQPSVHSKLSAVPSKSSSSEPKRAVTVLNSESSEKFELDSQLDCPDSDGDVDFEVEGEEGTIDLSIEDEFQVIFKPHPTKMALDNPLIEDNSIRYIKTTANATVNHLHKYLKMRLSLELGSELLKAHRMLKLCIYIARQPSKFVCLRGNQRLRQINDQFWKLNKPMEIFYSTG